jgi:putrescine transport system substrate-binding protein
MRLAALLLAALLFLAGAAQAQERVVNVYNWTDYTDPYAIARFQKETGIKVRYDVYDSLETLEGKLLAGSSGYDVVVPTSEPTFSRLVRSGALRKLDKSALPHLEGLDPALMKRVETSDPGNQYGAIYLWGTVGLGTIPAKIKALAPDAPMDSWDLLLKPQFASRIARCGISLLDSAIDVVPSVLAYLGKSPDSTDPADLAAVYKALKAVRPYIRTFVGSGAVESLAAGETCLALSYSGDVIQAAARATEAGQGVEVKFVSPKEGAQLWFDMLAIPKDAPHPQEAEAFIDFMLRPEVIAGITNQVRYANAVPASRKDIKPDIAGDPGIYPPPEAYRHFFTLAAVPADAARARSRMWTRLKASR